MTKRFGTASAVNEVSLKIARGEFFSLLGPSGCGKTTLLRMLGGFILPDEGSIFIDSEDVTDLPPNLRPTNMVFQSYAIFPHLNVGENIAYGLKRLKLSHEERARRVDEALALIRLEGYAGRRSIELSGGERQRVALARALVMRPKVLLLDEPLGALDKRLRESMQVELRQIQRRLGITFVFVTHDQEEALSMSDRVAVMNKGKILQVADPKTLYDAPNNRMVAEFVGTMNLVEGKITSIHNGNADISTPALGAFAHRLKSAGSFSAGDKVLVAIRPEKFEIVKGVNGSRVLSGRLVASAYLGDRHLLHVAVTGSEKPIMVATGRGTNEAGEMTGAGGDTIALSWNPQDIVLLPAD